MECLYTDPKALDEYALGVVIFEYVGLLLLCVYSCSLPRSAFGQSLACVGHALDAWLQVASMVEGLPVIRGASEQPQGEGPRGRGLGMQREREDKLLMSAK